MFLTKKSTQKLKRLALKIKQANPEESKILLELLKQGMISVKKSTKSEIEGYLTTAFQKYFQIMIMPNSTHVNHWTSPLKTALKNIVRTNSSQWARGYVLTLEEIKDLVPEAKEEGFEEAFKHLKQLKLDYKTAREEFFNQELSLEDIFEYAGLELPKWEKY